MFRSDEGPTLETLAVYYPYQQYTDLFIFRFVWLYSAYVVHYLYLTIMYFSLMEFLDEKYVYPIFILVIFIIHEMSKKGVLSLSTSYLVPQILRFLRYVN